MDSILIQQVDNIEILISNNASEDDTRVIISEYMEKHPNRIRLVHNETNVGADANFDIAVQKSQGKFVWLFSDDDVMNQNALNKVLILIDKHPDLAAIFTNYSVYSDDLSYLINPAVLTANNSGNIFSNANDWLQVVNIAPIFISSNIVRREYWLSVNKNNFIGSNWIHYEVLTKLVENKKAAVIFDPLVRLRSGANRWKQEGKVYLNSLSLMKLIKNLNASVYTKTTIRNTQRKVWGNLHLTIVKAKIDHLKVNWGLIRETFELLKYNPRFYLIHLPLLLVPSVAFKTIKLFRDLVTGHNQYKM